MLFRSEGDCGRDDLLGAEDSGQDAEAGIWDAYNADVGLDCGEGVIGSEDIVLGERVEEGRFSDIGKADDSD